MIDRSTIDKILDTADIVDVIQDFVTLKKRGVNYLGNCPFHNEKTPSFTVSPAKGIYKCFGCGKAGNVVNFVMEHEHLSYPDSLRYLGKKLNIAIEEKEMTKEEIERNTERESMMVVTSYAQKYFTKTLYNSDEGIAVGMSYIKQRGFSESIIKKFEVGYCPEGRDVFTQEAIKAGYKKEFLVKSGLTIDKGTAVFDRFSARVMFPIHNISGKVIGFGGRTLKADKKTAKYLNSPESEIYHKSKILYGIFQAKRSITQNDKCFLVEGYTDVMSLHQSGIENVVASSGTSLTQDQIRLIKRFTQNVTVIYDGDQAGIKASLRGIDMILEEGLNVKVVPLPEGEDPDSFAKERNASELESYIERSEVDFITFKTRLLIDEGKSDPVKRANLISDIVRSISVIPDRIVRSVYIRECSTLLNIDEKVLYAEVGKNLRKKYDKAATYQKFSDKTKAEPKQPETEPVPVVDETPEVEKALISCILNFGNKTLYHIEDDQGVDYEITVIDFIVSELENDELEPDSDLCKNIYNQIKETRNNGRLVTEKLFTNHDNAQIQKLSVDLVTSKHEISKYWKRQSTFVETPEDKLKESVPEVVLRFKTEKIKHTLNLLHKKLQNKEIQNDEVAYTDVMHKIQNLNALRVEISKRLGNRIVI